MQFKGSYFKILYANVLQSNFCEGQELSKRDTVKNSHHQEDFEYRDQLCLPEADF